MFGFMKKQTNRDILNSIRPTYITQGELDLMIYSKRMETFNIEIEKDDDDLIDNEHLPDNPELDNEKN